MLVAMPGLRRHIDPFALKGAVRAAIVMPAVFGFADGVIGNPDTTLFSAFGSFAILVLADFGGPPGRRLTAYVSFAVVGAVLIALGTLCSQEAWLAVAGMAVVGFAVLFGRLLGGYFAAGAFAAMLLFIIPIGVPGPISAIPDRLAGWFLAAAVGIAATMLLWPTRHNDQLRAGAARACRALADLIAAGPSADASASAAVREPASTAVRDLRRTFVGTPLRPTRPTGPTEALAFLVDALEWLYTVASSPGSAAGEQVDPCADRNDEVRATAAAVLRSSAENLEGRLEELPLERLEQATSTGEDALARRIDAPGSERGSVAVLDASEPSFRMRELATLAGEIGINALRAVGAAEPDPGASAARRTLTVLRAHATRRSASFRNSLRGAIGLAVAVVVIEIATVQHGFWIVLATLSVLRSTALGTGSTIFQALNGTVIGIVAGGLLLYVIGSDEPMLWAALPVAVLLAAYGSRALPFAAGQAGFTVTVLVIFNIIVPTGWQLGLVRVEDVAIGSAISLAVGLFFWPRGIESLVRASLRAAYERAADYLALATHRVAGVDGSPNESIRVARRDARNAADLLDDAFRQYLSEPSARPADRDNLATLVSGAIRVRLAAYSLSTLSPAPERSSFARCRDELVAETDDLRSWYDDLAEGLVRRTAVKPPHPPGDGNTVAQCVTSALPDAGGSGPKPALSLLWADHHLAELWQLGDQLAEPATELSLPRGRVDAAAGGMRAASPYGTG
jgi:uncharacterized membrane protein YccC